MRMLALKRLWAIIATPFSWEDVRDSGVWLYQENKITGARRALPLCEGGYQPQDLEWLSICASEDPANAMPPIPPSPRPPTARV